ncbi:MAG: sensor domain-containing diguanylate cyclase [Pseudomonadota bacterium]
MSIWRAFRIVRPLQRFAFLLPAIAVYAATCFLRPSSVRAWVLPAAALLVWGLGRYATVPRPPVGRLARRRLVEAGAVILAALDLASRGAGLTWISFVAFPAFLIFVYAGYRLREISLLLTLFAAFQFIGRTSEPNFPLGRLLPLVFLFLWIGFAAVFRHQETKKRRGVLDRLNLYEREAGAIEYHADEVETALKTDEKKRAHLATMIRERERTFRNLLEVLERTIGPHTAAFFLYDPNEEAFILKDWLTRSDRFNDRHVQPVGGLFRAVLREPAPLRLISPTGEVRGLAYYRGIPVVRSVLAYPIRSQDLLKGVLILDRLEPQPFSEAETETVERIASQLANAIDQSEALHAYFYLMDELSGFYAAVSELNRCLRAEDVFRTLLGSTKALVHYDFGAVVMYDAVTRVNRIAAEDGEQQAERGERAFPCTPEHGLVSWVVKNQAPLYYTHFRNREGKTPLFPKEMRVPNAYESVFLVPLHLKGEALGALVFASVKNHAFSRSVRKMIEVTALQAAATLKNARMVDQLEQLATTDGLTGLVNHRTFQETLGAELDRVGRHPAPVSLLLVDIDLFKKFNDEYGHPIGDFVLGEIARVLRRVVRKVDTVARYGGEEFAVILVNSSAVGASQMALRIVKEVARSRFQHQGLTLRVTLSVGSATYPDDALTREELIERADRALYESKRTGRDRATTYSSSLGRMNPESVEVKTIESAEEELRRMVDQTELPV